MKREKQRVGLVTAGLLMGLILSSLDQTIVTTAMPTVSKELGGFSLYSWVFAVYMLASTATMPIYGKMADLFGRRKMYLTGLFLFLAGSLFCGIAGSMEQLIFARGIQGLGAGALMPIAFTIVGDLYPAEKRGKFQGLFGAVIALASIFGPALGGIIVEQGDWGWIFLINLPIGIPAFLIMSYALKEQKSNEKRAIDWWGAISLTGAIISFLLGIVLGGNDRGTGTHYAWGSWQILGLFSTGAVLLALFIWVETKAKEPILPLTLFRIREITYGNMAGFFVSAAMFGVIAYIPLFVQGVVGVSPTISGYILTPLMLSVVVTSTLGGRLMAKVSFRSILIPSLGLMAAGFFLMSQMTVDTNNGQIVLCMIVTGLGMGAVFPTLGMAAHSAVDQQSRGVAMSSSQFFRSIGGTIGVSVFGTLLEMRMAEGLQGLSQHLASFPAEKLISYTNPQVLLDPEVRDTLPPEVLLGLQNVFIQALHQVFFAGILFICISLAASMFMGNARLVKREPRHFEQQNSGVPHE